MKRIVFFPYITLRSFAAEISCSMSFFPAIVALICVNSALLVFAITLAIVVLPVPGGPYKMIELSYLFTPRQTTKD